MSSLIVAYIIIENWVADSAMRIVKTIFALLLIGIVTALVVLTVEVASADGNVYESHNPTNAHEINYGYSIVADNYYRHNGNYDIQFDGNTCMRWLTDWFPAVVAYPNIITYTDYIDYFDLIEIIACEAYQPYGTAGP